jgi:hypothetical protein
MLLFAALALGGCSSVVDRIPTAAGGLPGDVPARPTEPAPYLPVNAMPPPRDTPPLSVDEQKKLEQELVGVRDRQAATAAAATAADQPPPAAPPATKPSNATQKPAKKKPIETSSKKPDQTSSKKADQTSSN